MLRPPLPKREDYVHSLHGDERPDPYYWMKNRDRTDVIEHLTAENDYLNAVLSETKPLQEELFKEMKSRIKEEDSSPATPWGEYEYYTRTETGREYQIYCRRKRGGGEEEILLDVNSVALGLSFCEVASFKVSPDHTKVAFALDRTGRRMYAILVKDLITGNLYDGELPGTSGGFVWAGDNKTIFATMKHPETQRSDTCVKFDYATDTSEQVHFEEDEVFGLYLSKSTNGMTIFLTSSSFDSSEVRLIDAQDPNSIPLLFAPRETKHEYHLIDGGDVFYIHSNWKAENFRLLSAPKRPTDKDNWIEVVPHDPKVLREGLQCFEKYIAMEERFNGLTQIRILDRAKMGEGKLVSFPDASYVTGISSNLEYYTDVVRISYSSPIQPATWYDVDFASGSLDVVKITEIPNYDRSKYEVERVWATAKDGTKVPMTLIGPKGFRSKGPAPTLVYAYGSYGYAIDPGFSTGYFSLIDRGFVYAIAHIRGGNDLGRYWYEQGRMMNKMNTFTDFIDCTDYLISSGVAARDKVCAMGGSAGGLLMGVVINLRPELYRAVVAQVPFVDALTTMLDPTLPLTTAEYEQWGNPNEKEAYEYIKAYSPYDQIHSAAYPLVYAPTGYHDSQVQYWEPAKWVAKLRDMKTTPNPVLLRTNMDAGHGGASGRFEYLKEKAIDYAFVIWSLTQTRH